MACPAHEIADTEVDGFGEQLALTNIGVVD
jgi:hypothetical protein